MAITIDILRKEGFEIDIEKSGKILESIARNGGICISDHNKEPNDYHKQCPCSAYVRDNKCYCGLYIRKEIKND